MIAFLYSINLPSGKSFETKWFGKRKRKKKRRNTISGKCPRRLLTKLGDLAFHSASRSSTFEIQTNVHNYKQSKLPKPRSLGETRAIHEQNPGKRDTSQPSGVGHQSFPSSSHSQHKTTIITLLTRILNSLYVLFVKVRQFCKVGSTVFMWILKLLACSLSERLMQSLKVYIFTFIILI